MQVHPPAHTENKSSQAGGYGPISFVCSRGPPPFSTVPLHRSSAFKQNAEISGDYVLRRAVQVEALTPAWGERLCKV